MVGAKRLVVEGPLQIGILRQNICVKLGNEVQSEIVELSGFLTRVDRTRT